jgi:shikimate kinase / 3-dehydroquinate synthase
LANDQGGGQRTRANNSHPAESQSADAQVIKSDWGIKRKVTRGIYLIGFSGSGKSTIAQLIGAQLRCPAFDLDQVIVERSGMTIPIIFAREGEAGFRMREAEALRALSSSGPFVIAAGGGTPVRPENRRFMAERGWIVCLEGRPETLLARIQHQLKDADPNAVRPMLDAVYPLDQVRALKHSRQSVYALADWTVHTDRLTPQQVAEEIVHAVELLEKAPPVSLDIPIMPMRHTLSPDLPPPIVVASGPWPYQAVVGWNHLRALGNHLRRLLPRARRVAVITDAGTWSRLGGTVMDSLREAGLEIYVREMPPDEKAKTPEEVNSFYGWLLDVSLRRDDIIMAVGGGVVDDLGGFVASTYMRGVALVKVPTSLEGMVDSSIGGKTALNHPRARNLIGTFFHPRLAWCDVKLLQDEPPRELRAAWAEVVKYGMLETSLLRDQVLGTTLFDLLERHTKELIALERPMLLNVIARCAALKAQVVAGDERDSGQYRIFLNYGHTIGHALEAASNYELAHGEAVAIGMTVEARLAIRLGFAHPAVGTRQNDLLVQFGLPTRLPAISRRQLLEFVHHDKKVFGDAPRWILPVDIGRAVVSSNVTEHDLNEVLEECSSAPEHK